MNPSDRIVTTVKIVDPDDLGNYKSINLSDYDSSTDTLWGADTKLPVVSGVITVPAAGDASYTVEAEGALGSDDIDKISGLDVGDVIILRASHADHTIVLKNGAYLRLGTDFSLDNIYDSAELLCIDTDTCIMKGGRQNAGA